MAPFFALYLSALCLPSPFFDLTVLTVWPDLVVRDALLVRTLRPERMVKPPIVLAVRRDTPAEGLTADGSPIVEVILIVATAFSSLLLLDDDQATALVALVPAEVVVVVFAAPALVEHVPAHRALVEKVQGLGA